MRLRTTFIAMKSNQNYNKTYPEIYKHIITEKSLRFHSLFLQKLAVIVEELSRKVLLCTQPEFFRILLH